MPRIRTACRTSSSGDDGPSVPGGCTMLRTLTARHDGTVLIDLAGAAGAGSDVVGGKAGPLGRLLDAGFPVPGGFVISAEVYDAAVAGLDLAGGLGATRESVERAVPPAGLAEAVEAALAELGDVPVAVRSSATTEDSAVASAAGQHDTYLGVRGVRQVMEAVRRCWASAWSARAVAYRARGGDGGATPRVAVIVQRLVDADAAGVLVAGVDGPVVVEGSWGLGESVVGGVVTPDSWQGSGDVVVHRTLGGKETRVDRVGERTVVREVPPAEPDAFCLDDDVVTRLAAVGRDLAARFGAPQDVEWAVVGDRIWLLQSRPVTAALPAAPSGGEVGARTNRPPPIG